MRSNTYYVYKNAEPSHRAMLTQEEMELLLQTLHFENSCWNEEAEGPERSSAWFSLVAKVMQWEG